MYSKTEIFDNQLKEQYIFLNLIDAANGVAGLDASRKISLDVIPDITDNNSIIKDASITQKGIVQLSNSFAGSSENLAVTEKALSTGLDSIRTFYTDSNVYTVANGDITVGQTVINLSNTWPTADLYGISVYRDGLYQNNELDFESDSISKTITLNTGITDNEILTVVFESVLNLEGLGSDLFYSKTESDNLLQLKAPILNPEFTGNPKAPTILTATDNSTSIANAAFVQSAFSYYIGGKRIIVSSTEPVGTFNNGDIWIDLS